MSKYDWIKLKAKYIAGNYESLKAFADKETINYDVLRKKASKWQNEKSQSNQEKVTKIVTKTIEKIAEKESNRNIRHLAVWDKILNKVEKLADKDRILLGVDETGNLIYEDITPKMMVELSTSMDKIQKGQRLAEGVSTAAEIERIKIEKQKLDILKKKSGDDENVVEENNKRLTSLASLLNSPVPDRHVQDFEEDEDK